MVPVRQYAIFTDMNKPKISLLSEEQHKAAIDSIINYFATEREEEIGIIAAEEILEFFLDEIGKGIYNKGVEDAKDFVNKKFEELNTELEISVKKLD